MKNEKISKQSSLSFRKTSVLLVALIFLYCNAALAQDNEDYEYEPDAGFHQEEWYDPSDWFDTGEGINYESDWNDYYYGYDVYDDWGYDYSHYPYEPFDENEFYGPYGYDYYTQQWYEDDLYEL